MPGWEQLLYIDIECVKPQKILLEEGEVRLPHSLLDGLRQFSGSAATGAGPDHL